MSFSCRLLRLISVFCICVLLGSYPLSQTTHAAPQSPDAAAIEARLRADITQLTQTPSRVPGTPGHKLAAEYVLKRFREIGLERVQTEPFVATSPVTKNASLTLNGRTFNVSPFYPNGVAPSSTPKAGITGPLIYAGMGTPSEFNGRKIEGSIVALDFNSGMNWITAADLGARAIVFLEPAASADPAVPPAMRGQAERKFASLPVEMPRYYAPRAVADAIRAQPGATATVKSTVVWDSVNVNNIVGWVQGTDSELSKETVVINAYYDSMSVVPDQAPGAEAAANCAVFLELARYFKANPQRYSLLFVANGAHHLALAGTRNFAAKHFLPADGANADAETKRIKSYRAFVGLDITSRTPTVGLFAKSWFYNQMTNTSENILLNQYFDFAKAMYGYAQQDAARRKVRLGEVYVDGVRGLSGRSWRSYMTSLVALDSEVATMAQKAGLSFVTANDGRVLQDTPFDRTEVLNYRNLSTQVETISSLLSKSLASGKNGKAPNDIEALPDDVSLSANFGYVASRAISRDVRGGITFLPETPLPDELLDAQKYKDFRGVGYLLDRETFYKTYAGVRGAFIERARLTKKLANGKRESQFVFIGPRVADPKGGGGKAGEIDAFAIDAEGRIIVAPDMGAERTQFLPTFTTTLPNLVYKDKATLQLETTAITKCFECRGIAFVDTLDQRYFSILKEMDVLDGRTDANPMEYGYLKPQSPLNRSELEPIAIVFGKPGARLKLTMAQGLLGKRLVLLNTEPGNKTIEKAQYQGGGVIFPEMDAPSRVYTHLAYNVAKDLWTLDQQRIALLRSFGISNERVQALHGDAGGNTREEISAPVGGAISAAEKALTASAYDSFYRESRRAFGLESRAYPDVEATQQDVLKGILFYLALLIPFAFFLERLVKGASDIRQQIIGTSLIFLFFFFILSRVHPAFKLAPTPFIVLLAFIIMALTVVVTVFLSSKFEAEIKRLKQGVHFADVSRLSATTAAIGLGIANMRRRPTRTVLTCVTLILLTFTVLSFTSVTASISNFARPWGQRPPTYAGMMVRQADWSPLQERAVDSISNEFRQRFGSSPALRSWYLSFEQSESMQMRVSNADKPDLYFHSPALLGLTPEEKGIGSPIPGTLLPGSRWFLPGERDVCILPKSILMPPAKQAGGEGEEDRTDIVDADEALPKDGLQLGLSVDNAIGKTILVAGLPLKVIGIFDDAQWTPSQDERSLRDLDDEAFTPVDYQDAANKAAITPTAAADQSPVVEVKTYQHMRANALLLLPYDTVLGMGGTPRSMAVGFNSNMEAGTEELQALLRRVAVGVFGATPDDKAQPQKLTTRLYSSVETTSYEGFASLVVPVLIAALIIANTMLGSVFERTREIGIYSSVGLAPVHVAALFIAEATVFAVLGSISGYLVAQTVAKIITSSGMLPGITLNYSSTSAVLSTVIVMATVLLSTIYPAKQASRMSQPDSERKWQMSIPLGDLWRFQFPFTVSGQQPLGVAEFLCDFFNAHTDTSLGSFYTDKVNFSSLSLREAVDLLNVLPEGVSLPDESNVPVKKDVKGAPPAIGFKLMVLDKIAASPETEVYRLSMRVWLAPFDMGVSQDVDILLMPSDEPGLYEMQLRLLRQSGELSAWKRVNRQFMSDLRRQLLLWRTIKPEGQQEYILRGRAHIAGETIPHEIPGAVVTA